jgi:AAA15 family ATPase/GTPase
MIIDFTLRNMFSIKDEITMSFLSNKKKIENDIKMIPVEGGKYNLYSFSAIYGPNASGKTNIIKALAEMIGFILYSHRLDIDDDIPVYKPFRLDKSYTSKTSEFQIEFVIEKTRYNYSIEFNRKEIIFEELSFYPTNKKATIFSRKNGVIKYGIYFTGEKKVIETFLLPNRLYLSVAANSNSEYLQPIYRFFRDSIIMHVRMDSSGSLSYSTTRNLRKDDNGNYKTQIVNFLNSADISVCDLKIIEDKEINNHIELPKNMPESLRSKILEDILYRPYLGHPVYSNGEKTAEIEYFNLENEESAGTIKMYDMASEVLDSLKNGTVLIIDEFNSGLHPLLNKFLINLFLDPLVNKMNAQLLVSTHDTCTLDIDILKREQIWFTNRQNDGGTELFCLDEFDNKNIIRNDSKYSKHYLDGRFGAVPATNMAVFLKGLH